MTTFARITLLLSGLAIVLFAVVAVIAETQLRTEVGGLLDGRFLGYNAEEAQAYLISLTGTQAEVYTGVFRTLDTVLPFLVGFAFASVFWSLSAGRSMAVRLGVLLAPLIYIWADLTENAAVAALIAGRAAGFDPSDVLAASNATVTKWVALGTCLLLLVPLWQGRRKART
ncbi:MAG: hypothetical protein AAGG57_09835 [Pseudomonadota bacterium]